MLIDPINTIFSACTAAITVEAFEYRNGKDWRLNLKDGTETPEVLWVMPFLRNKTTFKDGIRKTTQRVKILVLVNSPMPEEEQPDMSDKIDRMDEGFEEFLEAFRASSLQPYDVSVDKEDVYGRYDEHRVGLEIFMEYTFNKADC